MSRVVPHFLNRNHLEKIWYDAAHIMAEFNIRGLSAVGKTGLLVDIMTGAAVHEADHQLYAYFGFQIAKLPSLELLIIRVCAEPSAFIVYTVSNPSRWEVKTSF